MAVCNEEKYINSAVNSILNQSYQNIELVVVNDGSTDKTFSILKEIQQHDSRLYILNPGKVGKNQAFNIAMENCHGDWIGLFAGDDIMPPFVLEKFMEVGKAYNPHLQKILIYGLHRRFADSAKYSFEDNIIVPAPKPNSIFAHTLGIISRALASASFPVPINYPNEDLWLALTYRYFSDVRIQTDIIYVNYRIHDGNSYDHSASDFQKLNYAYHARRVVIKEFCDIHKNKLTTEQYTLLMNLYNMEISRYSGDIFKVLFAKGVPLNEKIKACVFCNKFLNKIKIILSRYLLGRL